MKSCQFAIALDYWAILENSYEFPNYLYEVSLIVLHPLLQAVGMFWVAVSVFDYLAILESSCEFPNYLCEGSLILVSTHCCEQWKCYGRHSTTLAIEGP
jgi:hypothetical protein